MSVLSDAAAWALLEAVPDPEIPTVSITELGIVRDVEVDAGRVRVTVTPTYAGCPATELIAAEIERALRAGGAREVEIDTRLAPAWTTDWLSGSARAKLAACGIAPPAAGAAEQPVHFMPRVACPRCGNRTTERLSAFGSTACKALYRCPACLEPFEYFKAI